MTTDGGRFDFEDGGAYVGGWSEGKAHGLGLVTGPRSQGEFSGYWEDGFEASGVYIWPSGNTFEGEWRQGKRHGLGVEVKGRWLYRGEWMTGFKGRYGVRQSEASGARYEGTWQLGMQDGTGVETYSDGSTFSGCWFHGTRHGLGVRQSVPFGLAAHYKEERRLRESLTSLRSQDEAAAGEAAAVEARERARRLDEPRGGFVLRGRMIDASATAPSGGGSGSKSNSLGRSLIGRLRKQRSAGDLADRSSSGGARYSGSLRSAHSAQSHGTGTAAAGTAGPSGDFFEEIVDPSTTEAYCGDWKQDKRAGLGVAERSDGLKYEGEWDGNKKHGYGATTFPDGSVEAGKYKNNLLVASTARRSRLFIIKQSRLRDRVETAVREARNAKAEAVKKAENAQARQQQSRQKAELAEMAAEKACQDAEAARRLAKEYAPDFYQPGVEFLKRRMETDALNSLSLTSHQNGAKSSASAAAAPSKPLTRQRNVDNPAAAGAGVNSGGLQVDGTLQVGGGGSRRGSFRNRSGGGGGGGTGSSSGGNPQPAQVDSNEVITRLQATPAESQPQQQQQQATSRYRQQQHQQLRGSSVDRVEPLAQVLNSGAPPGDHFDQYSRSTTHGSGVISAGRRKRDSGIGRDSSFEESSASPPNSAAVGPSSSAATASGCNRTTAPGHRSSARGGGGGDSDSGLSEFSATAATQDGNRSCFSRGKRRRTMPSLLSCPPVRPATVGPTIEDVAHSSSGNLGNSSYIIENGIRKRVQASESRPSLVAAARRAITDPELLAPLPRRYRIESQARLCKDLGEGSMPDVSVCRHIRRHGGVMSREEVAKLSEARRLELLRLEERRRQGEIVIRLADLKECKRLPLSDPHHGFITRSSMRRCSNCSRRSTATAAIGDSRDAPRLLAEATKLLAAAAQRSYWDASKWCRRSAKDWCQDHLLLVFVFVINTGLALLFFSLLTSAKT